MAMLRMAIADKAGIETNEEAIAKIQGRHDGELGPAGGGEEQPDSETLRVFSKHEVQKVSAPPFPAIQAMGACVTEFLGSEGSH